MQQTGKVSVWIGNIDDEESLVSYVDDGAFGKDYDFEVNTRAGRELTAGTKALPVPELVKGFSAWESFSEGCIDRAKELGWHKAHIMLILYAFQYVPNPRTNPEAPMQFLGCFKFRQSGQEISAQLAGPK